MQITKDKIREIAYMAWKGAANAHRMYPDNKHTFADYWDAAKNQFNVFLEADELDIFVSYELSLQLKEKGFDWSCLGYYRQNNKSEKFDLIQSHTNSFYEGENRMCLAPTHQQVIDWLRNEHNIHINPIHHPTSQTYGFRITGKYDDKTDGIIYDGYFEKLPYYEALNTAILTAITLIP